MHPGHRQCRSEEVTLRDEGFEGCFGATVSKMCFIRYIFRESQQGRPRLGLNKPQIPHSSSCLKRNNRLYLVVNSSRQPYAIPHQSTLDPYVIRTRVLKRLRLPLIVCCMRYQGTSTTLFASDDEAFWLEAPPPLVEPWIAYRPAKMARCVCCHGSQFWCRAGQLAPSWRCTTCCPHEAGIVVIDTAA
jgi:hypothetical protein